MKKQINEIKRMQQLAGLITESEYRESLMNDKKKSFTSEEVKSILSNNGIDDDYFESMGGKEIESGGEEWMDVLSDITGKDAYEDKFSEQDDETIANFFSALEDMGIELV